MDTSYLMEILQNTYHTKDLYPEYIKESFFSSFVIIIIMKV